MIFYFARRGPTPTSRPFFHARGEKFGFGFAVRPILHETRLRKRFKNHRKMAKKLTKTETKVKEPVKKKPVVPSVSELEERIKSALVLQQTYSSSLDIAIAFAAGNYHTYLKTLASINKRAKVMYSVLTREGSKSYKIFPDIEHLPAISRALKDSLKSLGLTLDTLEAIDNDPLDNLADKVGALLNG